jgi:hypothetical protein
MKSFLGTLILFFILLQTSAQHIDSLHQKIQGSWELSKYLSTNNGTGNESPDKIRRTKVFKKSNYTLNLYDVKSGKKIDSLSGNYRLMDAQPKDSNYEETIVNRAIDATPTRSLKKMVSIDEADRLIFVWTEKFITYTEIWLRSTEKRVP